MTPDEEERHREALHLAVLAREELARREVDDPDGVAKIHEKLAVLKKLLDARDDRGDDS